MEVAGAETPMRKRQKPERRAAPEAPAEDEAHVRELNAMIGTKTPETGQPSAARKAVQDEMAAVMRARKKIENQLAKYGDPFDLTNDLARPNIGVGERFGRFLGRITGQPAPEGSYDRLMAEWQEHTAKLESLEMALDAAKREERAARERGEIPEDRIGEITVKASSEKHAERLEKKEQEVSNIREIMDAAVMSYETKREDGILSLNAVKQIKNVIRDLYDRATRLLRDDLPYDQDVANIRHYLQNTMEILDRAEAQIEGRPAPQQPEIMRKSEEKLEEFEGKGSMREALDILEDVIAKKQALWEMTETYLRSTGKGSEKTAAREEWENQKRAIEALDAQGRVAWEERLSFGEKGFLQFQISELERHAKDKETPAWMKKYLAKEVQALKRELEKIQKAETSLRASRKSAAPSAEVIEEISPEEIETELTLEEMKRFVPDEVFRYNRFKQAFLETFQVKANDSEKKREAVARKKLATYEKLRRAMDAEKNADLAETYLKRLGEYRLLLDNMSKGIIVDRKAADARIARLKTGLDAVKNELGFSYENAEERAAA